MPQKHHSWSDIAKDKQDITKDNATQKRKENNERKKKSTVFVNVVTNIQNHISEFQPKLQITDSSNLLFSMW